MPDVIEETEETEAAHSKEPHATCHMPQATSQVKPNQTRIHTKSASEVTRTRLHWRHIMYVSL